MYVGYDINICSTCMCSVWSVIIWVYNVMFCTYVYPEGYIL